MPKRVEIGSRRTGELGDPLDAEDAGGEASENRRRVAGAGTDFEHALVPTQLERLADRGDHPRLRDRLLILERQRRIRIGAAGEPLVDESLAGDLSHRREHAFVGDAAPAQLALDHALALNG